MMRISLTQEEVQRAIENYVYANITGTGKIIDGTIEFTAGRKGNGTTCDLEFTSSPMLDETYTEEQYTQPELPFNTKPTMARSIDEDLINDPIEESDTVASLFNRG